MGQLGMIDTVYMFEDLEASPHLPPASDRRKRKLLQRQIFEQEQVTRIPLSVSALIALH